MSERQGRHEALPEDGEIIDGGLVGGSVTPTQQQYPWKAFWRTFVQTGIPAVLGLLVVLPVVLQEIVDGFGRQLPENLYAALVGFTAAITLASAIVSKVMANAHLIAWTRKYLPFLAPDKK